MKRRLAFLALALAFVAMSACKKRDNAEKEKPEEGPAPMSQTEQKRGTDACTDFKLRACKCAAENPDSEALSTDCTLADSRIEALKLSVRISGAEGGTVSDRTVALNNARKVIERCIERAAELGANCGIMAPTVEAAAE